MESNREEIRRILSLRRMPTASLAFLGESKNILIYGAGKCGRDVLKLLSAREFPVAGFLDSNISPGSVVDGCMVRHPDDPTLVPSERKNTCVVIAIFNPFTDIAVVMQMLRKLGYERIVTFPELHKRFPGELGIRFWLTSTDYYDGLDEMLADGLAVWGDEQSRDLYRAILSFRCSGDYAFLPAPSSETQYFDTGVPCWKTPISFIDCGSFCGDTLDELYKRFGTVNSIAAFEPDRENFTSLVGKLRAGHVQYADHVFLYPCGVWSETAALQFDSGSGASSALSSVGRSVVQCIALDDALPSFKPTLIKMDIEGAELHALQGASRMIHNSRPALAICLYHAPEHLWQIPLLLRQWNLGYRFYLRCYEYSSFDTVLYAIPE